LKKRTKDFDEFRLSLCGKAEASLAKVFCCFFSKKQAFLPLALPVAAYLGSYKKSSKKRLDMGAVLSHAPGQVIAASHPPGPNAPWRPSGLHGRIRDRPGARRWSGR
jgi:hypothetical protein